MTKTGDTIVDRQLKTAKAKAVAAVDMDLFNAGLPSVAQVQSMTKTLTALQRDVDTLKARPATVKVLDAPKPAAPKATVKNRDIAKSWVAATTAEILRYAGQKSHDQTLNELLGGDANRLRRADARKMLKAATDPATTTNVGFATELVQSDTLAFARRIEPTSVAGALLARGIATPLVFGANNSITVPSRAEGDHGKMRASWRTEGGSIPVVSGTLASQTMMRHSLSALSVFSNELIKVSTPAVAALAEEFIFADTSIAMDEKLLSSDAATTGTSPGGLLFNTAPLANGTTPLETITALRGYMASNRWQRPVLIMDSVTALDIRLYREDNEWIFRSEWESKGTVLDVPFIISDNCPAGQIIAMDGADIFLALGVPSVDTSASASVVMIDADGVAPSMASDPHHVTPTSSVHISDAAGTTPQSEVHSVFQQDSTALRCVWEGVSWAKLRMTAVTYASTSGWV